MDSVLRDGIRCCLLPGSVFLSDLSLLVRTDSVVMEHGFYVKFLEGKATTGFVCGLGL